MIRFVHITDEDVEAFGGAMNPTNGRRFEDLKSSEPIRFCKSLILTRIQYSDYC